MMNQPTRVPPTPFNWTLILIFSLGPVIGRSVFLQFNALDNYVQNEGCFLRTKFGPRTGTAISSLRVRGDVVVSLAVLGPNFVS
ncbi:hypothetical protein K438DRAFT_409628 [Mycena galopus ATCC 62051]|nr:hypothetical protein K438DRAFT_409628 [Mycena galopus ATCC 62051]